MKRNAPCGVFVTLKSLIQEEMPDGHVLASSRPIRRSRAASRLGDNANVMSPAGTDVYRFLTRQRGHKVKIVLPESGGWELSKLERSYQDAKSGIRDPWSTEPV